MRITRQRANNCGIGKSVHILRGTTDSSRDKDFVYSIEQNTSGGIDVATDTTLPKKSS
jgi:hypothetical protein